MKFPRDLSDLPEIAARHINNPRLINRKPAAIFYQAYDRRCRNGRKGIAFMFPESVYFIAQAAAAGVIGNLAYGALAYAVRRIRKPTREVIGGGIKFELVISRSTYNRQRRQRHPGKKSKSSSATFERKLENIYSLMVSREPHTRVPNKKRQSSNAPKKAALQRKNRPIHRPQDGR